MAEDLLPLIGGGIGENEGDSSDSDGENEFGMDFEQHEDEDVREVENASGDERKKQTLGGGQITFDPSLPGAHAYLGDDLEDVRGRTVHEDESCLELPLLSLPGVVLVPGQTLPLQLFQPATVSMIRNLIDKDKTFGMVTARYFGGDSGATLATIGTTAEIFSFKEENDDRSGIVTVRVKAMGRQRFRVEETRRKGDGILMGKVRILPERILPNPLEGAKPPSHGKFCYCDKDLLSNPVGFGGGDHETILRQFTAARRKRQVDRFTSAYLTWWPPWVYKIYDVYGLMRQVKEELKSWNETLKPENLPKEPEDFSYWVAGNLPLDDGLKLHLMSIDSAVQRLRCELSIMKRCTVLCCKDCGLLITNKNDVFSMALEGPLGAYVNPGGHVHETLTVYKVQGVHLRGRPSTEHSWFPGYAWTIVECRHCGSHMGWKFTVANKKDKHLKPEKFWGLCRSSLLPGLQNEGSPDETTDSWKPQL